MSHSYTDGNNYIYDVRKVQASAYNSPTWSDIQTFTSGSLSSQRATDFYDVTITKTGSATFTPPSFAFYVYLSNTAYSADDIITSDEGSGETPEIEDTKYFVRNQTGIADVSTDDAAAKDSNTQVAFYDSNGVIATLTDNSQVSKIRLRIPIWMQRNNTGASGISALTTSPYYLHIVSAVTIKLHVNWYSLGEGLFTLSSMKVGSGSSQTIITDPTSKVIYSGSSAASYEVVATKPIELTFTATSGQNSNSESGALVSDVVEQLVGTSAGGKRSTFVSGYYDNNTTDDTNVTDVSPSSNYEELVYTSFTITDATSSTSGSFTVTFTPNTTTRTISNGIMNVYFGDTRTFTADIHPTASP